ncbi:hypothetical protein HN020_09395 [Brevibacillus borstelensis]|uniref:hypothetical protein n=1 Tax=Brevibacillus borstelensis TaxID=45462 RepID=UPI00046A75A3|nr:hypothetical protein [Brevibacillus borstelensis]NOU54962.1 hypothetical protein [Brevibacillus borstelensis]
MDDRYMVFDKNQLSLMLVALVEKTARLRVAGDKIQAERHRITLNTLADMSRSKSGYLDEEQLLQVADALEEAALQRSGLRQHDAPHMEWLAGRLREIKAAREKAFREKYFPGGKEGVA